MPMLQPTPDLDLFYGLCAATVRHACVLLRLFGVEPTAQYLVQVVGNAPRSRAELRKPGAPRKSSCRYLIERARERITPFSDADDAAGLREAELHFLGVIPALSRTERDRLEAAVKGVVHGMCAGRVTTPVWRPSPTDDLPGQLVAEGRRP